MRGSLPDSLAECVQSIRDLANRLAEIQSTQLELVARFNTLSEKFAACEALMPPSVEAINLFSDRLSHHRAAVVALAAKLDADTVTGLDNNFESTISALIGA